MNSLNPVVIIPVYKTVPDCSERISYLQAIRVLGHFPLRIVCPVSLDAQFYAAELCHVADANIERFPDSFFGSIKGYNQLLVSKEFYEHFATYSHMLIYQLDAYVFRDELLDWCSRDYDFIGAPLFEGYEKAPDTAHFINGANGGFSLRKIQSAIGVISDLYRIYWLLEAVRGLVSDSPRRFASILKKRLRNEITAFDLLGNSYDNEDVLWSVRVPDYLKAVEHSSGFFPRLIRGLQTRKRYKVAPFEDARQFAFECLPERLMKLNGNHLGFGCHAWNRYDSQFWDEHIIETMPYDLL